MSGVLMANVALSYSIVSAFAPLSAAPVCVATTATPCETCTTSVTPLTAFALLASNDFTTLPKTGGCTTVANFRPGTRASTPYAAFPVTFAGVSS